MITNLLDSFLHLYLVLNDHLCDQFFLSLEMTPRFEYRLSFIEAVLRSYTTPAQLQYYWPSMLVFKQNLGFPWTVDFIFNIEQLRTY